MRKYSSALSLFCLSLFSALVLSSCSDMFFSELKIENFKYDSQSVIVKFNQEINEQSLLKAFKVTRDNKSTGFILKKEDDSYKFFIDGELKANCDYVVTIDTNLESADGISLKKTFIEEFSTRNEKIAPFVAKISPFNEEKVNKSISEITIEFSETVDTQSFEKAFSISPACQYCLEFEDGNKIAKLVLAEELKANTEYLINISTALEDLCRNNLKNEFNSSFVYKESNEFPEYKVFLLKGEEKIVVEDESQQSFLTKDSKLRIEFTKKMDFSTFSNFLTFVPSLSYKTQIDYPNENSITLSFNDICWNDRYALWLRKGIKDDSELKTQNDFRCSLIFDNQDFMNVRFVKGFLEVKRWNSNEHDDSDVFVFDEQNNFGYAVFNVETFKKGEEQDSALYLIFDTSNLSDGIDEFSVMENFSTSVTNRAVEITLKNISKITKENYVTEFIDNLLTQFCGEAYFNLSVIKVCLKVKNSDSNGIITFHLDKSISDTLGNTMKEEKIFKFNK
ncbi:Ig-like domain-containing protein [Treponema pectinovorum]|uniref:Ig-like domain-containing protein n=1 Tax=Treponema pectinovorum TaxID=164 RepID=UPI003D91E8A1